jgi:hypothetical protein
MDLAKEPVYWTIRVIIISVTIVIILLILGSSTNYNLDIDELNSYIIRNKIILDENCLAYNNYRTNLGIIDKSKFNEINIKNCLNTKDGIILNLTYEGKSESITINNDLADKRDFCYDEKTFLCIRKRYDLILNDKTNEIPVQLTIDTIHLK